MNAVLELKAMSHFECQIEGKNLILHSSKYGNCQHMCSEIRDKEQEGTVIVSTCSEIRDKEQEGTVIVNTCVQKSEIRNRKGPYIDVSHISQLARWFREITILPSVNDKWK